jgi:acyl-CoA synthetase (AMP-forming)/AMP-acid ligase II
MEGRMGLRDYTLYEVIKRNARVHKDKIALVFGEQRITHKKFLEKVDRLAYGLFSAGIRKGDRIAVLSQNNLEFIYLFGAAAKIGAIMLPINWRLNQEEIEYVVLNGTPKIIFVGSEFQPMISPSISKFGFIEKYYSMNQDEGIFEPFNELLKEGNKSSLGAEVGSDDGYIILQTAAIQGRPRGAVLSHRNLITSNLQVMYNWGLKKEDVHLLLLPLFHFTGVGLFFAVLQTGGLNIILPKFDVDIALKCIQEDRVTIFGEFPPILKAMLDKAQDDYYGLSSLRGVVGLDQPETVKRFEEMTGATFWTVYGQSETSGFVSTAPFFERPGSAGVPSFIAEMEIMDDYGNILETGKIGEILVQGPLVFQGYWNLKEENEFVFRDGWHHTGDMGKFDEDGYLWYTGRTPAKELIKQGGENVYPAEVEKIILGHPFIEEVAVIGVPDSQWGEAIKAVCVLREGKSMTEAQLIEFVAGRIARFKKPKYAVFTSNLPRTEDGHIDREKVKANYGSA